VADSSNATFVLLAVHVANCLSVAVLLRHCVAVACGWMSECPCTPVPPVYTLLLMRYSYVVCAFILVMLKVLISLGEYVFKFFCRSI
jgi:hypothetical protein